MKQPGANHRCRQGTAAAANQLPSADRFGRHVIDQTLQQARITDAAPIPVQQPQIGQQRTLKQLPFGDDAVSPALVLGVGRGDRLFAADVRPVEFSGGLDLQQIGCCVLHLDEKVGDDVRDSENAPIPGIASTPSLFLRVHGFTQQLKLHALRRLPPGVRDGKRLFPDRQHARAIGQNHGGRRFELSLAADRAPLPVEGHQNERAGSSSSQMEGRR